LSYTSSFFFDDIYIYGKFVNRKITAIITITVTAITAIVAVRKLVVITKHRKSAGKPIKFKRKIRAKSSY
jgi:hypothetical protein